MDIIRRTERIFENLQMELLDIWEEALYEALEKLESDDDACKGLADWHSNRESNYDRFEHTIMRNLLDCMKDPWLVVEDAQDAANCIEEEFELWKQEQQSKLEQ